MWIKHSQGGKVGYQFDEYLVEKEEELSKLNKPNMGDMAYVITTGEYWIMDSKKVWHSVTATKSPIECDCVEESTIWNELK